MINIIETMSYFLEQLTIVLKYVEPVVKLLSVTLSIISLIQTYRNKRK
ncbi:hypothetical protein HPL003_19535 [Paenibacillus terrae HPL-003]|uniref:Uncharacterized protein n=1 Tax=Paenibacillus terrae (strain HPL-003) TaxID=985665 RepID=G7W2Y9_PAETH|nr:hypothetical protein HPL003_19535 [Paenibacillus terrae HPL-003]